MSDNQTAGQQAGEGQPLNFEALVENGKLLGKYDTPEALVDGYWNSVTEMNAAKAQLGAAIEVIKALKGGQPAQAPPQKPVYETQLESLGVPVEAINNLIDARARNIAREMVGESVTPLVQGAAARSTMESRYPDFAENLPAIMANVKRNPELNTRFEAALERNAPLDALELGYFNWKSSQRPASDPATEAAKRAAGIPQGGGGTGRLSGVQTGPSKEEFEAAQYQASKGNIIPLLAMQMKDVPMTYTEQMEALMRGR